MRGEAQKETFSKFCRTIQFFLAIVRSTDDRFTLEDCKSFFMKNCIQNSRRRFESADRPNKRASRTESAPAQGYGSKSKNQLIKAEGGNGEQSEENSYSAESKHTPTTADDDNGEHPGESSKTSVSELPISNNVESNATSNPGDEINSDASSEMSHSESDELIKMPLQMNVDESEMPRLKKQLLKRKKNKT